jgi:hypothetical protein
VTTNPFSVKTPGDETPVELQALARFDPVPPSRWRVPPFRLQREEGAITSMLSGFIGGVDTHAEHWRVRRNVSVLKGHQPLPVAVRVGKAVCDSLPRHLEYPEVPMGPTLCRTYWSRDDIPQTADVDRPAVTGDEVLV